MTCKERCKDCAYLIEGDNGEWICDDWGKDIHEVVNDDCELTKHDINEEAQSMDKLHNDITRIIRDFASSFTNRADFECALGMITDYWCAIYGESSEEVLKEVLDINIAVNTALGIVRKDEAYAHTDLNI